jgi:ribosomal small subunit protein bTHX
MGKGDKKSVKGKIWRGSYGNTRRKAAIKSRLKRKISNRSAAASLEAVAVEVKPKVKRTTKKKESAE